MGWMEVNHFDKDGAKFILEVAKNNCGLVLPGCQPVYNPMYGQWLYKKKKMYEDLAKWMPEFHKTGAKLFVQLTAGFGRSFTISSMMETLYTNKALRVLAKPVMDLDKITAAPSPSPNRWSDKVPSREMTVEEIKEFITAFGKTAKLLKDAGVDGVEIHAVHEGYLLDQFTLKYVNKRTDEYGGSFENRYRFAVEIVKEIKRVCGKDFPVSLRYSVESKTKGFREGALPGEEYVEAGRDMAESEKAVKYLQDAGMELEIRHIVEETPTVEELRAWVKQSGLELKKFFNTSGNVYKELKLKDRLKALSEEEQLNLLAGNGMLIKRPLLICEKGIAVGFKEDKYKNLCSE